MSEFYTQAGFDVSLVSLVISIISLFFVARIYKISAKNSIVNNGNNNTSMQGKNINVR